MIVGIVSGYFNPVHRGHIEYINAAKKRCDQLVCIVNNDEQVKLKGSIPFMDEDHRCFIMSQFKDVDWAWVSVDSEKTVCESIACIKDEYDYTHHDEKPTYRFFNSGDRAVNSESKEVQICKELGIEYVTLPLPKVCSSSELIHKAAMEV